MAELPHYGFVDCITKAFGNNPVFIGIAVGGSYMDGHLDEYSDLDIHLVVEEAFENLKFEEKQALLATLFLPLCCYSNGNDDRVMVCLYDFNPIILHVDWKWQTLKEFEIRVENPKVLFERDYLLSSIMERTDFSYPLPDIHNIEPRFWSWMHYVLSKIGRGELLEANDYLSEVRSCCIGPLILYKNGMSPRRMRHAESLPESEWMLLSESILTEFSLEACFNATTGMIKLYQYLREGYIGEDFQPLFEAESACLRYVVYISRKIKS